MEALCQNGKEKKFTASLRKSAKTVVVIMIITYVRCSIHFKALSFAVFGASSFTTTASCSSSFFVSFALSFEDLERPVCLPFL